MLPPLLLLLGCAPEPAPTGVAADVARYERLLQEGFTDPEQALAVCAGLSDPKLAGDCALVIAMQSAKGTRQDPALWCARVPAGAWRDECHFEGAEMMARRGQTERAAALCRLAGAFRDDCGMHLWMGELGQLTAGMGTADLAARLPRASQIFARWEPALSEDTDISERFWKMYYQNAFGQRASVDLSVCAPLPEADRARCAQAGADLFLSQLAPMLERQGGLPGFCAGSVSSAQVAPWLGATPHPALDAALEARRPQLCESVFRASE